MLLLMNQEKAAIRKQIAPHATSGSSEWTQFDSNTISDSSTNMRHATVTLKYTMFQMKSPLFERVKGISSNEILVCKQ